MGIIKRLFIVWSLFSLFFCGYADSQLPAKNILAQALHKTDNITFTAKSTSGEGKNRIEQSIYQLANPDGTVNKRIETRNAASLSIFIINNKGIFDVFPATQNAVKRSFDAKVEMPNYDDLAQYEMKDGRWKDRPCHVVKKTIPINDEVRSRFKAYASKMLDNLELPQSAADNMFKDNFVNTFIYYISKDDLFIYATEYYNQNGSLKGKSSYNKIDFSPEIDEDVFNIPSGYKITVAKDPATMIKVQNTSLPKRPSKRGGVPRGITFLALSRKVLFGAAALSFAAIVFLHLRKKKTNRQHWQKKENVSREK